MSTSGTVWLLSERGILDREGVPLPGVPFREAPVTAGHVQQGNISVIADGSEIWSFSEGRWLREASGGMRLHCLVRTPDGSLLVGTERARLARVQGNALRFIKGFDSLEGRKAWYTPWGGPPDVRSLAVSTDGTLYADIHVGGIARSGDGGRTWKNLRDGLEADVHQVGVHPRRPGTVFAATARGFYISRDHGDTFARRSGGMPYDYQRACACLADGSVYLVSTSRGPHGRADAMVFRSGDEGIHWEPVSGLPRKIRKNIDTFQIGVVDAHTALAVVNDTSLYRSDDRGRNWRALGHDYPRLYGMLVL